MRKVKESLAALVAKCRTIRKPEVLEDLPQSIPETPQHSPRPLKVTSPRKDSIDCKISPVKSSPTKYISEEMHALNEKIINAQKVVSKAEKNVTKAKAKLSEAEDVAATAREELEALKTMKTIAGSEANRLRKRQKTNNQLALISQRIKVHEDAGKMKMMVEYARDKDTRPRCDQMTSRGRCRARNGVDCIDGQNYCHRCFAFQYKEYAFTTPSHSFSVANSKAIES